MSVISSGFSSQELGLTVQFLFFYENGMISVTYYFFVCTFVYPYVRMDKLHYAPFLNTVLTDRFSKYAQKNGLIKLAVCFIFQIPFKQSLYQYFIFVLLRLYLNNF